MTLLFFGAYEVLFLCLLFRGGLTGILMSLRSSSKSSSKSNLKLNCTVCKFQQ